MTTSESWHAQWVTATMNLSVASLNLLSALRTLAPEQIGALRPYRDAIEDAQRTIDRLKQEKADESTEVAPEPPSQEWPR